MDHEGAMNTTKLKAALADCVEALAEMAMQGAAEEATEAQFEGQPLTTEEEVNLRAWLETDRFGSASIPVVRRLLATLDAERSRLGELAASEAEARHAVAIGLEEGRVSPRVAASLGRRALTTEEEASIRVEYMSGGGCDKRVLNLFATLDAERAAKGILLPGWTCSCGCFNGSAKELRSTCRTCGAARPT
ncbi:MAG: hypothetical protein KGI71_04955 [Patescibacteria group bacterium]|nr:hypothetical protein [Patescibacteria group bacterium]